MRAVVAVVVILALAACGDSGDVAETVGTSAATADPITIEIDEFAFPATVAATVGTEITWRNAQGGVPHTVTADEGPWAGTDSGRLAEGDTFTFTPTTQGDYTYFCSIHPSMTGRIAVTG